MRRAAWIALLALAGCDGPTDAPITAPADVGPTDGSSLDRAVDGAPDATPDPPDAIPDAPDATPDAGPTETVLRLALDAPDHPTGDLIGWNIGRGTLYAPESDPLHPEWRTPERAEAAARMASIRPAHGRPPLVRFSGLQIDGALGGDGYHFAPLVDPMRAAAPDDNMAPWQYMALVDEMGAEPVVTVNFGTGTADEAARYLRHLTGIDPDDPTVAARHHWGPVEPWRPAFYEVGNESYGWWNTGYGTASQYAYANPEAGDPPWHGRPSSDPADFAARALTYIEAMQAEVPDARFFVPLSQAPMDAWGGLDAALAGLEPLLRHPAVAAVVVHHYQVDDLSTVGLDGPDDHAAIVAGTHHFAPGYAALLEALAALDRPTPLRLAITEYHVAGAFARGRFTRADQAVVGLGVADLMLFYARIGVAWAQQHMALNFQAADDPDRDRLLEAWYVPYRRGPGGLVEMPSARVTRFIAEQMLSETAVPIAEAEVTLEARIGGQTVRHPALSAVAFVDGADARLVVLNRDPTEAQPLVLALPPGWAIVEGATWDPAAPDQDAVAAPTDPTALPLPADGPIALPPASVSALALERR